MPIKTRRERSRSGLRSPVLRVAAVVGLVAGIAVAVEPAAHAGPITLYAAPTPHRLGICLSALNACSLATALATALPGTNIELITAGDESDTSTFYSGGFSINTAGTSASAPVTIEPAPGVTAPILDGGSSRNVLTVGDMYLDITGVTVQNGNGDGANSFGGGGISDSNGGTLTVTDSIFSDDSAPGMGGAIDVGDRGTGTAIVTGSTFSGDHAFWNGGAIGIGETVGDGVVTVTASTFDDDGATYGGAIDDGSDICGAVCGGGGESGSLTVADSSFSDNAAYEGGAIDVADNLGAAVAVVTDSTFSANSATAGDGGAIDNGDNGDGYAFSDALTVTASTFAGNTASANGGTIDSLDNGGPNGGSATIGADVFAGSCATNVGNGPWIDEGFNVGSDTSCFNGGPHDASSSSLSSLLGPLASNGGPTQTMALLAANPAIGIVPDPTSGLCPVSADQRGVASPSGAACNAGAVQALRPGPPIIGVATAGDTEATVTFSPPADIGNSTIANYTVEAFNAAGNPTGIVASGPASPLTVTGLTDGDRYTFEVAAFNAAGEGPFSSASNPVISGAPLADAIPGAMTLAGPAVTATKTAYVVAWQSTDGVSLAWTSAPATARQSAYAWTAPQVISGVRSSAPPALATFKNKPYMAWKGAGTDSRIWVSSLTGNQWQAQTAIPGVGTSTAPTLAAGRVGTTPYLVAAWKGAGTDNRLYDAYTTNGKTWTIIGQIPGNAVTDDAPALAISGSTIFLTWTGAGKETIHESQSTLGTFNWTAPIKLKGAGGTSKSPALASLHASATIQAVWKGAPGDDHIFTNDFSSTTSGSGQKQVSVILTNTNPGLGSVPDGSPAVIALAWKAAANDQIWIAPLAGLSGE